MLLNRIHTNLLAVVALTITTFIILPASLLRAQAAPASTTYSVTVINRSKAVIY
jgi:hypothetical protein